MFVNNDPEADIDDVRDIAADFLEEQEEAYGVEKQPEAIQEKKIYAKGSLRKLIMSIVIFLAGIGIFVYVSVFYLGLITIPGLSPEASIIDPQTEQEVFDSI